MDKLLSSRRVLLLVLWVGLFTAGCMAQMGLIQSPIQGAGDIVTQLTKTPVHGSGDWSRNADGSTDVTVRLAPLRPDAVPGRFRVQDVATGSITSISAFITAPDIATPIMATGASGSGSLAVTGGALPALSFAAVPAGVRRVLTIQGYDSSNQPIASARIRTLFDNASASGGFEVSPRTTPAADTLTAMGAVAAASVSTATLNGYVDTLTGVSGSYPHSFTTHPSLVDTSSLAAALTSSNGSTVGLTASAFRMPGARITFSFFMPFDGAPTAADQPTIWIDDPASKPVLLPPHPAGSGTLTLINTATCSVVINDNNMVDVTFLSIAPGTWKAGVSLSNDNTPTPNARYFHTLVSGSNYTAGHATTVTISLNDARTYNLIPPSFAVPALDPKWVADQVRYRDDSAVNPTSQNCSADIANGIAAIAASGSVDKRLYFGPNLINPPYAVTGFAAVNVTAGQPVELLGPPNCATAARPVIAGGETQIRLNDATQSIRDLSLQGVSVAMASSGGKLERVTVSGVRGPTGIVAGVLAQGSTCTIAGVHVYDVRNTSAAPAMGDAAAGIVATGSGNTHVYDCLVDDNSGFATSSIRFDSNGGSGKVGGIISNSSGMTVVTNSQVIGVGRATAAAVVPAATTFGIHCSGVNAGTASITACTVANLEADDEVFGIVAYHGTVANNHVRDIATPFQVSRKVVGIQVGHASNTGDANASNNKVENLGDPSPVTGTSAVGIYAVPPSNTGTPALHVSGNTLTTCRGGEVYGVQLDYAGGDAPIAYVQNNSITGFAAAAGSTAVFKGIGTSQVQAWTAITIHHNDISAHTLDSGITRMIDISATAGALTASNNRISNNTFNSTANNQWNWIKLSDLSSATAVFTGNQLLNNTVNIATGNFYGLKATGGSATNPTFTTNTINGNTISFTGGTPTAGYIGSDGSGDVSGNRIYNSTYNGAALSGATIHSIEVNPSSGFAAISGNLISENLGLYDNQHSIYANTITGTVQLQRNSFFQTNGDYPIARLTGGGTMEIRDNVFATNGSAAGIPFDVVSGTLTTNDFNTGHPWAPALFFQANLSPVSAGTADRTAGSFPYVSTTGLQLITAEKPTTDGGSGAPTTVGYSDGGTLQRGFWGSNPAAEPVF